MYVLVTGSTGGIGEQTATRLAEGGAHVLLHGRDEARARAAAERVRRRVPGAEVDWLLGDVATVGDLDRLSRQLRERVPRLDVLVNNAGAINHGGVTTSDGTELAFAVNVVAPYRLTWLLADLLEASPDGRVVNVSGGAPVGGLRTRHLDDPVRARGIAPYSMTKRAMEAVSLDLAGRLGPRGITVLTVHPGSARTAMTAAMTSADLPLAFGPLAPLLTRMRVDDGGRSAVAAATSSVRAATDPSLRGRGGTNLGAGGTERRLHRTVRDARRQAEVVTAVERALRRAAAVGAPPG